VAEGETEPERKGAVAQHKAADRFGRRARQRMLRVDQKLRDGSLSSQRCPFAGDFAGPRLRSLGGDHCEEPQAGLDDRVG
jgi:hypothetical protein